MSNKMELKTIEQTAILAKLALNEEEKEQAARDMEQMLNYIDKLKELDTEGVEPMTHIFSIENVTRKDEIENGDNREAMLKNAPRQSDGQFHVPKTVE